MASNQDIIVNNVFRILLSVPTESGTLSDTTQT